jgi:hypothetical protein
MNPDFVFGASGKWITVETNKRLNEHFMMYVEWTVQGILWGLECQL